MINIHMLLMVAAFICFVLAAIGVSSKVQLTPLGLAFWVLSILIV
jgi:hypothetical protein